MKYPRGLLLNIQISFLLSKRFLITGTVENRKSMIQKYAFLRNISSIYTIESYTICFRDFKGTLFLGKCPFERSHSSKSNQIYLENCC